ncbi:MAG TPA: DUF892 family protein [Bryobacteraceae bacterium]|nr:DUF892 family protein [Bryobacteraceae bacterium]
MKKMMEIRTARDIVIDYLDDAIAAEKNFETQLQEFAKNAQKWEICDVLERHAEETRLQHSLLAERLSALGGVPSGMSRFLSCIFNLRPRFAEATHSGGECQTQDLMLAYIFENSKVAMYEALAVAASAAGDAETEALARRIQERERQVAGKLWEFIAPAARESVLVENAVD